MAMLVVERCLSGQQSVEGTLLMDAPDHGSAEELAELAECRAEWNRMCNAICPKKYKKHKSRVGGIAINAVNVAVNLEHAAKMRKDLMFRG